MTVRVLDILNFSNRRNPQADSGVQLKKELISAILRHRDDFFFYVLVPWELCLFDPGVAKMSKSSFCPTCKSLMMIRLCSIGRLLLWFG